MGAKVHNRITEIKVETSDSNTSLFLGAKQFNILLK
jgi:hypothetical protein